MSHSEASKPKDASGLVPHEFRSENVTDGALRSWVGFCHLGTLCFSPCDVTKYQQLTVADRSNLEEGHSPFFRGSRDAARLVEYLVNRFEYAARLLPMTA